MLMLKITFKQFAVHEFAPLIKEFIMINQTIHILYSTYDVNSSTVWVVFSDVSGHFVTFPSFAVFDFSESNAFKT